MSEREIVEKTGIECRRYTERTLEDISLQATRQALEHAGRSPDEIGAVVFCTCTSTRLLPSIATWLRAAGLEGVISKRRDSIYQPGERSAGW
jgi:3-oxoacyl-[acyl-carrier-protein] synthase III